jgi:ATP-dependent HslUV protease ATP-binding subunit HslU
MNDLTPRQIVAELDKYIIGQDAAKRAVAIALRNRWRRRTLPDELRDEVIPKNILMIGPTGVGKTEIARRLAKLADAPFVKVEATKFTEVGYVGRNVESMVRDLAEASYRLVEAEKLEEVKTRTTDAVEDRLVSLLLPRGRKNGEEDLDGMPAFAGSLFGQASVDDDEESRQSRRTQARRRRKAVREQLQAGALEDQQVEVDIEETSVAVIPAMGEGMDEIGANLQDALGNLFPKRRAKRRMSVREARHVLAEQEARKLIDQDALRREAIDRAEQRGIIFVDEIDKVAGQEGGHGPDVSRGGVQRDILPIIEGSTINTKYGPVRTDYVLFIAAGAFHTSKPSDLIPELQGRLPIRVELEPLRHEDFRRILTEPANALTKQYEALLATEKVTVQFTEDGLDELARMAAAVNERTENIGARRLHTLLERVFEEVSFGAPDDAPPQVILDAAYVRERLSSIVQDEDLSRYIL